ncbi:MAG: PepSY-associated TM helix domain-containing protein [Desulfobulbaceae bacterium]|nr:PepSY-associated TM helix domain-containing protein [Desulfobulbaceae bacterium]
MKVWRKIHKWVGLLLSGFIVFYCVTGVVMNHRKRFDYFLIREKSFTTVPLADVSHIKLAIEGYAQLTNEQKAPTVVKFKGDGTIELLYGSHGVVTYVIRPEGGTMEKIVKKANNPFHYLDKLHKSYKTTPSWLVLSDIAGILILAVVFSGLAMFRYTNRDIILLVVGICCLVIGALIG